MPTSPSQLIDQSVRHSIYLERLKSGYVKDYSSLLERMESDIIGKLNGDVTEWSTVRMNRQLSLIRESIANIGNEYEGILKGHIDTLAPYEAEFEVKSLGKVVEGFDFTLPSNAQINAAVYAAPLQAHGLEGVLLDPFMKSWSEKSATKISGQILAGYARGETTTSIVKTLLADNGELTLSKRGAEAIVRTSLAHTAQVARSEVWDENKSVVKGVRITATIDSKTTSTCRSLDGQFFPLKKGPRPPFHINCRTTTVAALDDRFKFLDEGATRSSRDPQTGKVEKIPAKQTYYAWLKRQPAKVQDSIIGTTRGKLLRNGGLSSERFAELQLGKNFKPITLDEMRKLEPTAFEKANL